MLWLLSSFLILSTTVFADYEVRVGDLVFVDGIKKNIVTGYGLVAGLSGTGDSRNKLTKKTINQYLNFVGIQSEVELLHTKNVAIVAVSAELHGLYEKGDLVDVHVASVGDAENINNGLLLPTTLKSANGDNYVVAAGVVVVNANEVEGRQTRGQVIAGGIVETPLRSEEILENKSELILNLKSASVQRIHKIKELIREKYLELNSTIIDYKKIKISHKEGRAITFKTLSELFNEFILVSPSAKIIIDKNSGIVVVANNVKIDSAFVSLPGISIEIEGQEQTKINNILQNNATIQELAEGFNSIGLSPDKIISIFIALKKSGAINADIITQ